MCTVGSLGSKRYNRATSALQLFFAALYAFVLPFICAGAQATPGHPHARAHFVFLEPELVDHKHHAGAIDDLEDDMNTMHRGHAASATEPEAICPLHRDTDTQTPAGRSVPMQLVTSGLILLGSVASIIPLRVDSVGFSVWLADSIIDPVYALIPTPPPR